MKLLYCIHSIYNPGGMERVLLSKAMWLYAQLGWEIVIATTDQGDRPSFFPIPKSIRLVDMRINYSEDKEKNLFCKTLGYLIRRRKHKKALTALLMAESPEIVVSLYPCESSFIPKIQDGSKKVLEIHQGKFFRIQYGRSGLLGLSDRLRTWYDETIARRFDKFVVLSDEDADDWGEMPNLEVIPNAARQLSERFADTDVHRVIAIGRLDYQKGFDRLIRGWKIVKANDEFLDWTLDIFGQGEWHEMLQEMVDNEGLSNSVHIKAPVKNIVEEYLHSSILVMTSHYEGFPMVMLEAMSCGLPVVTFDYKCGPKDIIADGENGLLVKDGDIGGLAEAMMRLMKDNSIRQRLGEQARKVTEKYSQERIMGQWVNLFEGLVGDCHDRCAVSQ